MNNVFVRVVAPGYADASVQLSRVPCVGELIEFRERRSAGSKTRCVRVLSVRHYNASVANDPFAAQVFAEERPDDI